MTRPSEPSFGALLRTYRMSAGLSQEALAERAGLTTQAIGALERGVRRRPYPETVRRLADALSLSPEERAAFIATVSRQESEPLNVPDDASAGVDQELPMTPLPAQVTPLIGREHDIAVVTDLLMAGARLVTFTGPGGVGKTRLAMQIAANLRERYARGAVFVDLAPIHDPSLVLPHIGRTLGIRETGERSVPEALRRILGEQSFLLVLDNFEHILAAATDVSALLAAVPGLAVLATSREPLRLRDEREVPVASLEMPAPGDIEDLAALAAVPSVALFLKRAVAARPTFALSPINAPVIAELCRRLDGLPLALELAAARLKILSPAALLARIEQRLDLLASTTRDIPARHQTLRGAIGWSYDLLPPVEQTLFRRLAVFVGGCTVESLEAVCATPPLPPPATTQMLNHLNSLVDKNLIYCADGPDGEPRFRMLETIGEFAREALLESGEEATIQEAHAQHIVALVEEIEPQLWGPEQARWIARLTVEQDNVRAALRWLLDHDSYGGIERLLRRLLFFWWMQGQMMEARRWAEEALARKADVPQSLRAYALLVMGWAAIEQGDDQVATYLEQARDLARAEGNRWIEGLSLVIRGFLGPLQGDVAGGIALMWEGQRILREMGDEWGVGLSLTGLSALSILTSQLDDAERFAEEHVALARRMGDIRSIGHALDDLAMVALMREDHQRAIAILKESIALSWEVGQLELVSYGLQGLAVAASREEPLRAAHLFGAAAAFREAAGVVIWPPRISIYDRALAMAQTALGQPAFEAAWAEGRAMKRAQVVAYALHGNAALSQAHPQTDLAPSADATAMYPSERA